MRDNESISREIPWINTQGSASGLKDGHFSSFWDNAVSSSQKLLDTENKNTEEDSDESSRENESLGLREKTRALSSTPGFASTSFSRSRLNVQTVSLSDLAEFGSTDRSFQKREFDYDRSPQPVRESSSKDMASSETARSALDPGDAGDEDENPEEAKSAERRPSRTSPLAGEKGNLHLLNTDNKRLTNINTSIGTEAAKKGEHMSPFPTAPEAKTVSPKSEGNPTANLEGDSGALNSRLMGDSANELKSELKSIASQVRKEVVASLELKKQVSTLETTKGEPSIKQDPKTLEKPVGQDANRIRPQVSSGNNVSEKPLSVGIETSETEGNSASNKKAEKPGTRISRISDESLLIDSEKAKSEISAALRRASRSSRGVQNASSTGLQNAVPQSALQEASANSDTVKTRGTESIDTNKESSSKLGQTNGLENRNPNVNNLRAQQANRGIGEAAKPVIQPSQIAEGSTASSQIKQSNHSVEIQNVASRDSRPVSNAASANRGRSTASNLSVSTISNSQSFNAQKAAPANQSQSQSFDTSSKNEASQTLKTASQATRAEKPAGEPAQAFQTQSNQSTSSQRSQAAAKAQMTSYASKTASEVKEVFSMVSKGLERMTGAGQNTMTIRISFDQGGMLSLKLSMDNGQVNTSMQTDLPGLESMIKSNWSELANDWSQKGLKLNLPQFSHGDVSNDSTERFDQKEGRSQNAGNADQKGSRQSSNTREAKRQDASSEGEVASSSEQSTETNGSGDEQELQTYA